ncbi:PREDICTED: pentatricopeptide repeat-containing protein At4g33170-like [Nicotiana attenuata]|uniref:Pentatricopeptide repeat-containing protein n=1 Tax=Nicotiana attenuata TaxID=49451 RepID=A0A1J6I8Z0_NICAT|nr:PREDICTED: pentatricopeptide repeat-containing protein At4g33170-like [Nicotiana attenuata]XP_019255840.1 PREDICTED: pentatricopeptide repeat-containing protein At4g33170-like [Nicotiana attenuata]XP_019255841.1 PREDICTED: pentatricopeptide repeat-containing protein At4g33170-like [Nicotiana attenuata]OIS97007.1 pentatricopeptide repeat-containing protein [Nicotiana attenuata]
MVPEILGSLLHHCSKTKGFCYGLSLHAAAIKSGLRDDVVISNHILNMYAKCGNINFASQVFNEMSERNLITWSAMISGYSQDGKHLMAINLYSQMPLEPNEFVLASALSSCSNLLALKLGRQIHAQSIKLGCSSISFVSNSLISMYMKNGQCGDALSVFARTPNLTDVSYNAIIMGLVESNQREKAFEVYKCMCRQGLLPDCFTFVGLLGTCNSEDDLGKGMQLHSQTMKLKLDGTAFIGNVIMIMYSNINLLDEAEKVFRSIKEKDVISWNTLIAACSRCDDHSKALRVFREMLEYFDGRPDEFTYASVLSASAGMGSMQFGRQIHAHIIRTSPSVDIGVGNALVNMYAKCGCIQYAYTAFRLMTCHNLVSWNSVIAGFANHGHGKEVIKLFEEMRNVGLKPDSVTFLGLLIACNHAGLVDEGLDYFNTMNEIYGVTPDIEHFSCLIDLLGRAGRLKDAEEYMQRYPFGHDPVVLGCLLSACRLHGDVVIGERMAKKLLQLRPVSTSPYVLLSNLYASDEKWDSVAEARKMLKGCGLKKEAGHSLIEVKGSVEKFTIGDFSNSRIEEIMKVLGALGCGWDEETFLLDSA